MKMILSITVVVLALGFGGIYAQPPVQWIHTFGGAGVDTFDDIYVTADGDYVMCGYSRSVDDEGDMYVVKTDSEGQLIWERRFENEGVSERGYSLIELDEGDYVIAGKSNRDAYALRVTPEGESVWFNTYGIEVFQAVIELKGGDLMFAGFNRVAGQGRDDQAVLTMVQTDGDLIWQRAYNDEDGDGERFYALRETEGGVIASGGLQIDEQFPQWFNRMFVIKVDFEGELVWMHNYLPELLREWCFNMCSTRDGFILAGRADNRSLDTTQFSIRKIDGEGQEQWADLYDLGVGRTMGWSGACRLDNDDVILVGYAGQYLNRQPTVQRITAEGVERWHASYDMAEVGNFVDDTNRFRSVVQDRDGSIIACGKVNNSGNGTGLDGFIMKLAPELLEPQFLYWEPEDTLLTVLLGDTVRFLVRAFDQQDDKMDYLWIMGEDTLFGDTTTTIIFEELGEYFVQCQVSDREFTSSITWHVSVVELYISEFTPDSLEMTVRRNSEVPFRITARAVDGDPLQYIWTCTDLETNRDTLLSVVDSAVVVFPLAHDYTIEATAYRGELSDVVSWLVHVRSTVWAWWPLQDSLRVPLDDVVEFGVEPFNPESDSLSCRWTVDGDSVSGEMEVDVAFPDEGFSEVVAYVNDGCEADTLIWIVDVYDPEGVNRQAGMSVLPDRVTLYPAYPNPFNNRVRIDFILPSEEIVRLAVYDVKGREVSLITDQRIQRGKHTFTWENDSAGLYFIVLQAGNEIRSTKVVCIK